MTNIIELFSGIGIIIDEAIFENGDALNGIQTIASSLREKNIPLLEYDELPDESVCQFHSVSFVILDWNLSGEHPIPEATINDNIAFIQNLQEVCFAPLFIFSDEEPHDIQVKLEECELYTNNCPIFIKRKDELKTSEILFSEIEAWIKQTPSIYVLKEWEKSIREAKTKMLWSLSSIHPAWPSVLYKTIHDDGGDEPSEIIRLLQTNLSYRLKYPQFDIDIINTQVAGVEKNDLRRLLECERFIPQKNLPDHPFAGDIYSIEERYYLNIRPDCDIIRNPKDKDMYLLKGNIIDEKKINSKDQDAIKFDSGEFLEKKNICYVAFVQGHILSFSLRDLAMKKWKDIKDKRIGRLLPPYITKVQQKYAAYLQRQGLPSIPEDAI